MGPNELILLITGVFSVLLVLIAWRLDKERLYSAILIFLILIAVAGGKIVTFFGHQTNTGNIFYASIFLSTYFLIERYGKREGIRSIWIGVVGIGFFVVLLESVVALTSAPVTQGLSAAFSEAFAPVSRLGFASICAYILAQSLNVSIYIFLKNRFQRRWLWLRANISNVFAQLLDSLVFFTIAFWGVTVTTNIVDILVTGFLIKVIFMLIVSPLLYLNKIEEENTGEFSVLTLHS